MTTGLDAHVVARQGDFTLDVELAAAAGNVLAVLGPNGAGKSTLLRVLAGLQQLTDGHIRVDGTTIEEPSSGIRVPAQRRGSGLVPQASMLFPHLSALDQVAFGPRHQGATRQTARAEARDWLRRTGLTTLADRRPAQLSGGQARRVAIARALALQPAILLMDEPFGALDEMTRERLNMELLRIWERSGSTIVFVTHSIPEAVFLSTRVVVMSPRPGRIAGIVEIVLPQPRGAETREQPRFFELVTEVRERLAGSGATTAPTEPALVTEERV